MLLNLIQFCREITGSRLTIWFKCFQFCRISFACISQVMCRLNLNKSVATSQVFLIFNITLMEILKKIFKEIRVIARTAAYFAVVFLLMMVMKKLYLADYNIEFTGVSQAIVGALIMAKVILLMELITFGSWVQSQPPIVDVTLRTLLYSAGVVAVTVLEKAFEARHEAGSFGQAFSYLFNHRDIYHVWATAIGSVGSIFVYNAFSVVQRTMGKNGLANFFFKTPLAQIEHQNATNKNLSSKTK
jgi:hypothetical protein